MQHLSNYHPNAIKPLANFCLLLLNPILVDRLELRGDPKIALFMNGMEIQQTWSIQMVNP
jgi:hypothetical protein